MIDTEKGTVKFGVNESEYFEIGTEIRFFTKFGTKRWTWILDRTSGDLDKFITEVFDPDNSIVTDHEKFTCTERSSILTGSMGVILTLMGMVVGLILIGRFFERFLPWVVSFFTKMEMRI